MCLFQCSIHIFQCLHNRGFSDFPPVKIGLIGLIQAYDSDTLNAIYQMIAIVSMSAFT